MLPLGKSSCRPGIRMQLGAHTSHQVQPRWDSLQGQGLSARPGTGATCPNGWVRCFADPKAQAVERAAHAEQVAALTMESTQLQQAAEAAQAAAAVADQRAAAALQLLPPGRRSGYEAAARSAAALSRLTASRRGTQVRPKCVQRCFSLRHWAECCHVFLAGCDSERLENMPLDAAFRVGHLLLRWALEQTKCIRPKPLLCCPNRRAQA